MLQLLKNLRSHSQGKKGKEITDADILNWANEKVKKASRTSRMESFRVQSEECFCVVILFQSPFSPQLLYISVFNSTV